jgi:glycine cleavage system regulatory protein
MMQRAGLVLRRSLSTKTPTKLKGHAPRVVAHVVGPDRVGILSEVNRIIAAHGGKVHDTRVATLGGTFAVTTEIEVDSDSSAIQFALQSRLPDYVTCLRPEAPTEAAAVIFGRLVVTEAKAMGVVSQIAEEITSRGIGFATLRTSESVEDGVVKEYTMNATLNSRAALDIAWIDSEFAHLGDKFNCRVELVRM